MGLIKITNQYLGNITWLDSSECDFLANNRADVWRINISSNLFLIDDFSLIMHPAEIESVNRYFQTKDKNRYIISRGAIRIILGWYLNQSPSDVEFGIGINKKPYIKDTGTKPLHYNISHSGDWIVIAVSSLEIGVDTEQINPDFHYNDIIEEYFNKEEVSYIGTAYDRFFTLWTRKEALVKATAKGLDQDLKLIPCLDGNHIVQYSMLSSDNDWLISSFKLHEQYIASVANNALFDESRFWDVNFNKDTVFS